MGFGFGLELLRSGQILVWIGEGRDNKFIRLDMTEA